MHLREWEETVDMLLQAGGAPSIMEQCTLPLEQLYGTVGDDTVGSKFHDSSEPQELFQAGSGKLLKSVLVIAFQHATKPWEELQAVMKRIHDDKFKSIWYTDAFNAVRSNVRFSSAVEGDVPPTSANEVLDELVRNTKAPQKARTREEQLRRQHTRNTWLRYTVTAKQQQCDAMLQRILHTGMPTASHDDVERAAGILVRGRLTALAEAAAAAPDVRVIQGNAGSQALVERNDACRATFAHDVAQGNVVQYMYENDLHSAGVCLSLSRKEASRRWEALSTTYSAASMVDLNSLLDDRQTRCFQVHPLPIDRPMGGFTASGQPDVADDEIVLPHDIKFSRSVLLSTFHVFEKVRKHGGVDVLLHEKDYDAYFVPGTEDRWTVKARLQTGEDEWTDVAVQIRTDSDEGVLGVPAYLGDVRYVTLHGPIKAFKALTHYDAGTWKKAYMSPANVGRYGTAVGRKVSAVVNSRVAAERVIMDVNVVEQPRILRGSAYVSPQVFAVAEKYVLPVIIHTPEASRVLYANAYKCPKPGHVYLSTADMLLLSPANPLADVFVGIGFSNTALLGNVKPNIQHSVPQSVIRIPSRLYGLIATNATDKDDIAVVCLSSENTAVYGVPEPCGDEGVSLNMFDYNRITEFQDTPSLVLDQVFLPITESVTISVSGTGVEHVDIATAFRNVFRESNQTILRVGDAFTIYEDEGDADTARPITINIVGMQPLAATRIPRIGGVKDVPLHVL